MYSRAGIYHGKILDIEYQSLSIRLVYATSSRCLGLIKQLSSKQTKAASRKTGCIGPCSIEAYTRNVPQDEACFRDPLAVEDTSSLHCLSL